ncbi:ThiF family adenylyltransferase [Candidatus Peribacteria bacterium]|nr:ThiF family adenylyltransferase [Candidatus Peribacteria bacterium]
MSLTSGQQLALDQIQALHERSDGVFEYVQHEEFSYGKDEEKKWLKVHFSVACRSMPREEGGLPLRDREGFIVYISPHFPFKVPEIHSAHKRFAGFPHVQFMDQLCLYQSPSTEWNPNEGMIGFIERLDLWLRQGAMGQLDPVGAPIHPPVAYTTRGEFHVVNIRKNAPEFAEEYWLGTGQLKTLSGDCVQVTDWMPLSAEETQQNVAAAIFVAQPMPFEFPKTVRGLFNALEERGVPRSAILLTLKLAALFNADDSPLYLLLGTPMRGVSGSEQLQQHITAWYLPPVIANGLRATFSKYSKHEKLREIGQEMEKILLEWADAAEVIWCKIDEARDEIVVERDYETPIHWFKEKSVSLWGCGALGAQVALMLARAGVQKIILHDNDFISSGILARQPYQEADIGSWKATKLAEAVHAIDPNIEVVTSTKNLLYHPLDEDDWTESADIVIDTTASNLIRKKLELRRREQSEHRASLIALSIGHKAKMGMVVIADSTHVGGAVDVMRRAKIASSRRTDIQQYADEFWPLDRRKPFQPEPGCSQATFVGSLADVSVLAGTMLNCAAGSLQHGGHSAVCHFIQQPSYPENPNQKLHSTLCWERDIVLDDPQSGYEIRISSSAWNEMQGWIRTGQRTHGVEAETGGLLFGEYDDIAKIVWVSEVSGPPPDSEASPNGFVCGNEGTQEMNTHRSKRSRGSVQYIGMWHTHPESLPLPSVTDHIGMSQLLDSIDTPYGKSLMLIVETSDDASSNRIGGYVFTSNEADNSSPFSLRLSSITQVTEEAPPKNVGLALSGGGSRAIAFHLGCLRALHERGILPQLSVVSAVSGGSVIAAMYAYSQDDFGEFERRVVNLLKRGLQNSILARTVLPHHWLRRVSHKVGALDQALRDMLFSEKTLDDERREEIDVVLNACDLRTGTVFRFGSKESGCWRYGSVSEKIPIATAVAASAAYPLLLAPTERHFEFTRKDGTTHSDHVILTDGGIFDNLGVTCMEPGRSEAYSYNVFSPEYIICCNAGAGHLHTMFRPTWWIPRIKRSFEAVFRKVQDGSFQRLHSYAANGQIKGFVLSHLGQQDKSLPYAPPDLVRREEVIGYPTDFAPMSQRNIDLLSRRGEQLTGLLIEEYCSEL